MATNSSISALTLSGISVGGKCPAPESFTYREPGTASCTSFSYSGGWPGSSRPRSRSSLGLRVARRSRTSKESIFVDLRVLRGAQPHLVRARGACLGPRGDGHQHQALHLVRIVEAVLQRNRCAQRVTDQHEVPFQTLRPQPAAHPFHVSRHVRTPAALEVAGQGRRDAVREMPDLIVERVSAGARAGSVEKHELRHATLLPVCGV